MCVCVCVFVVRLSNILIYKMKNNENIEKLSPLKKTKNKNKTMCKTEVLKSLQEI